VQSQVKLIKTVYEWAIRIIKGLNDFENVSIINLIIKIYLVDIGAKESYLRTIS
jgi:hypothetical protein